MQIRLTCKHVVYDLKLFLSLSSLPSPTVTTTRRYCSGLQPFTLSAGFGAESWWESNAHACTDKRRVGASEARDGGSSSKSGSVAMMMRGVGVVVIIILSRGVVVLL